MNHNSLLHQVFCSFLLLSCAAAWADDENKRPLDHSDYDRWNTISTQRISNDGNWVLYSVNSGKAEGDSNLVIRSNRDSKEYSVLRGRRAQFTFDSKYAIYEVAPDSKLVEKLKKEKTKPEDMPSAQLEVLDLATGAHVSVPHVKSFSVPAENGIWMAFLLEKPHSNENVKENKSSIDESYEVTPGGLRRPVKPPVLKKRPSQESTITEEAEEQGKAEKLKAKKETEAQAKPEEDPNQPVDDPDKKEKSAGTVLVVRNLSTGDERRFPDVARFQFSKNGKALAFATSIEVEPKKRADDKNSDSKKEPAISDGVFVIELDHFKVSRISSGFGNYKNLAWNEKGSELAFITDRDDYESKTPGWSLFHWKRGSKKANLVATEKTKGVPDGWWISTTSSCFFSEDNRRLFFETAPVPETVEKEREEALKKTEGKSATDKTEDEEKRAKLDIWHWQDPLLQPQQLLQAEQERNRNYTAVYDVRTKKIIQLADREFPTLSIDRRSTADLAVAVTNMPYRKMLSWDIPGFKDSYLVNLKTGERKPILEKSKASARLSPAGKYVTWFDAQSRKWFAASTGSDQTPVEISQGINFPLQNELHDTPSLPRAYGSGGWLKDDKAFLIYDRFDLWRVDPTGKTPAVCLTEGVGRGNLIRFRYVELDREARSVDPALDMILSAFDESSKASGYYVLKTTEGSKQKSKEAAEKKPGAEEDSTGSRLRPLIMLDERIGRLSRAKDTDDVMFTRSTFRRSPDIWTSTTEFKEIRRISDINPQQDDYLWGTAELVHWKATDGEELDGLLYKPDNFDPSHKYPLMVYFYERNSDNLHQYYTPTAGRSIINHSFYVSRGYVLFVPDIPYKTGEPGPSAVNAVLPGTQSIIDLGFIDATRVGMQGHSWGGYQTAYLVTQTDMFACAESGAPVSNMTSAYGGIRWGSGMSRMFQYERSQSRIGETLWAAREKYIANSPLFFADKVNTPLLILHNDEDGAVPWYQGIELFVALRRLEKPAWLLNYNGNPHWVMGQENRRDFAVRMQQFFDHYLKGEPEPEWMAYGVPAVDKGEKWGLELLEPEPTESESEKTAVGSK